MYIHKTRQFGAPGWPRLAMVCDVGPRRPILSVALSLLHLSRRPPLHLRSSHGGHGRHYLLPYVHIYLQYFVKYMMPHRYQAAFILSKAPAASPATEHGTYQDPGRFRL